MDEVRVSPLIRWPNSLCHYTYPDGVAMDSDKKAQVTGSLGLGMSLHHPGRPARYRLTFCQGLPMTPAGKMADSLDKEAVPRQVRQIPPAAPRLACLHHHDPFIPPWRLQSGGSASQGSTRWPCTTNEEELIQKLVIRSSPFQVGGPVEISITFIRSA